MAEGKKLRFTRHTGPNGTFVRLQGILDETFDPVSFSQDLTGVVVLDLDSVERITSYGMALWMDALAAAPTDYLGFINVRPSLVMQFNMVEGFGGRGELLSFYSPHVCGSCNKEVEVLLDVRKDIAKIRASDQAPAPCPNCGGTAEFDEVPDTYFEYVQSAPPPDPPPEAVAMVEGTAERSSQTGWKVRKEVEGSVTALWCSGPLDLRAQLKRLGDGLEGDVVLVMDRVTGCDEGGMSRLRAIGETEAFRLHFARVPINVVETVIEDPAPFGKGRLLSLNLDFLCGTCGRRITDELNGSEVLRISTPIATARTCPNCRHPMEPVASKELLTRLAILTVSPPTPEIRQYLLSHFGGPGKQDRREGEEVWGKYRLGKLIGSGGMAQVYLARQVGPEGFEKRVVIKRLHPHISENHVFVEMFLQEARLAARLSHPNVVQILELGRINDQYFMAMEYVRGCDLHSVLKAMAILNRPMPIHLACRIFADVCSGLAAAHRPLDDEGRPLAIVHRDVSPQNILLSDQGVVKLTDFGIAKAAGSIQTTQPGTVRGKIAYMAPEQVQGGLELDGRADIFAAGVVLYHCITGVSLFKRASEAASLAALMNEPIATPSTLRRGVPPRLDEALRLALARERDRRYDKAQRFQMDLEAVIAEMSLPATPTALADWLRQLFEDGVKTGKLTESPLSPTPISDSSVDSAGIAVSDEKTLLRDRPAARMLGAMSGESAKRKT